jgi:hypothetical protein
MKAAVEVAAAADRSDDIVDWNGVNTRDGGLLDESECPLHIIEVE